MNVQLILKGGGWHPRTISGVHVIRVIRGSTSGTSVFFVIPVQFAASLPRSGFRSERILRATSGWHDLGGPIRCFLCLEIIRRPQNSEFEIISVVHACSRLFTLVHAISRYFCGGGEGCPRPRLTQLSTTNPCVHRNENTRQTHVKNTRNTP